MRPVLEPAPTRYCLAHPGRGALALFLNEAHLIKTKPREETGSESPVESAEGAA